MSITRHDLLTMTNVGNRLYFGHDTGNGNYKRISDKGDCVINARNKVLPTPPSFHCANVD